jgi:hypothetical protein
MNNLLRYLSIFWIGCILTIYNVEFASGFVNQKSTGGWSPSIVSYPHSKGDYYTSSLYMHNDGKKANSKSRRNRDRSSPKGFGAAIRQLQMETFPYAGTVRPGKQSQQRTVTGEDDKLVLQKPDYWSDGLVRYNS